MILMPELRLESLQQYLSEVYKKPVVILKAGPLDAKGHDDLKGFGYGVPCLIEFKLEGKTKKVVLETMRPGGFGHEFFSDRAAVLLWQNYAFNLLPKHVRALDVGSFLRDGQGLKSLGDCCELFLLTDFVEGKLYHFDLDEIKEAGVMTELDEDRCVKLADYLAEVHATKKSAPEIYIKRIRDLLGHGEGIFGLTDSYPRGLKYVDEKYFVEMEKSCVEWRWRLKTKPHRLSQVHGDFHPWNIMFREGADFTVLDRSRGEFGEPADDLAALTVNYIFYSLQEFGELAGPFEKLFALFWKNYLDRTGDDEVLQVVQPFYAWRSIVLASPLWYPNLSEDVRRKIFRFTRNTLKSKEFDIEDVNSYLK